MSDVEPRPRVCSYPEFATSAGPEAIQLAASAGLFLDPWQQRDLTLALAEDDEGLWAAFEVAEVAPRQNGKNGIVEARELSGLFLFGEEMLLHSAHEFKTAQEGFLRVRFLIENTPAFDRRVAKYSRSHGDEGIELKPIPTIITGSATHQVAMGRTPRLRFVARTGGSGRGFTGDVVFLDEAFNIPPSVVSALLPTMSARPNPQLWYTSSPVNKHEHQYGLVLASVRLRGLDGDDPSLVYIEYSADPDAYEADPKGTATDPAQIAAANPALGIRVQLKHVLREQRSMPVLSYKVERLGLGEWPDPEEGSRVIGEEAWSSLEDPGSEIEGSLVFGADSNPEQTRASICVWGLRPDGLGHGEVIESGPGTAWAVPKLISLVEKHKAPGVAIDPTSTAGAWIADLEDAGVTVFQISGREMAQACSAFYESAVERTDFRHLGQSELNGALAGAKKRPVADGWGWNRKNSGYDISPLVAATLARHGFALHGQETDLTPMVAVM